MARATSCPEARQLEQLLLGQLPEDEAQSLEQHLSGCARCLKTVQAAPGNDTLVEALRARGGSVGRLPDVMERLMQRLKQLRSSEEAVLDDKTLPGAAAPPPGPPRALTEGGEPASPGPATQVSQVSDFLAPAQQPDELGRLGRYRVLKVLGSGGMGIVYLAEDPTLGRQLALKAMLPALAASAAARERFLREARAAATLEHEHVVAVYQVDEEHGVPFIAMPLLKGESLEDCLQREGRLPAGEVARIGRETAEGLAAAHARGMVHRDIKPANLWLDGDKRRVKILDFGLARSIEADSRLTQQGAVVGTPAYMAPEQGAGTKLDGRCDLFSLGVVLYRMATGRLPFRGTDTVSTLIAVATEEPEPPHQVCPDVPAGLSDVILWLLRKEPADRPDSAADLVGVLGELERNPAARPVPAGRVVAGKPGPVGAPAGRGSPRRRPLVVAAGLLVAAGAAAYWAAPVIVRIATNRGELVVEADAADIEIIVKDQGGTVVDRTARRRLELTPGDYEIEVKELPDGMRFFTKKLTVHRGSKEVVRAHLEPAPATKAAVQNPPPRRPGAAQGPIRDSIPAEELAAAGGGDPKNAPAGLVAVLGDSRLKHWGEISSLHYSPDGAHLASQSRDGSMCLWRVDTGKLEHAFPGRTLALSDDWKLVAADGPEATIMLWDASNGRKLHTLTGHKGTVTSLAFDGEARTLASASSEDGTVRVWDVAAGTRKTTLEGDALARSPDGTMLAILNKGIVRLCDAAAPDRTRHNLASFRADAVAFSPDGKLLAVQGEREIKLWDTASGQVRHTLPASRGTRVTFSPDDKTLAAWTDGTTITLWSVATGKEIRTFEAHGWHVYQVAFSPDGETLGSTGHDQAVKLWDLNTGKILRSWGAGFSGGLAFSPDGRTVATGSNRITFWNVATAKTRPMPDERLGAITHMDLSHDGRTLAFVVGNRVALWDLATAREQGAWEEKGAVHELQFHPDGKMLFTNIGYPEDLVHVREAPTGKAILSTAGGGLQPGYRRAAFSPDGKKLVAASGIGPIELWDLAARKPEPMFDKYAVTAIALAFTPDGQTLALSTGERPGTIKFWDMRARKEQRVLRLPHPPNAHTEVTSVAFSRGGSLLTTTQAYSYGTTLRNPTTGEKVQEVRGMGPVFSADGATLLTGGEGTIWSWDARTGKQKQATRIGPPGGDIRKVALFPDGRHVASLNGNGTIYILRVDEQAGGAR